MNWKELLEKLEAMKDEDFMNQPVKVFVSEVFEEVRLTQDLGSGELLLVPVESKD